MAKAKKKTAEQSLLDSMAGHTGEVSVSNDSLAEVSALAKAQYDAALTVARLEDELKAAKADLRRISEEDLPEAMKACGVKKFTTVDDLDIELKEEITVGIPAPRREEAYQWLVQHEFGGLIKSELELPFNREERAKAEKLAEQLRKKGYEVEMSSSIHPQTLKAFVKERLADTESGIEFPLELFGARPYNVAKVKPRNK